MYKLGTKIHKIKNAIFARWWLSVPLALIALSVLGAFIAFTALKWLYEPIVDSFDLSKLNQMEAASIVYDRNSQPMSSLFIENRCIVPYSEISPLLIKAVIAEEDNRFYQHSGIDIWGIIRAAVTNYRLGKTVQGGSTVTQQLARNSFDLKERTYQRKMIEIFLAMKIEKVLSKDQIMELYLNRVYFGSGFYGAEAAARGYFGKSAKILNASECALLAGLLKSPQGLSPWKNPDGALKTRNYVLKRMHAMGFISQATLEESLKMPLGVKPRVSPAKMNYALDLVRQQAISLLGFQSAMNEGFHIYTTLDLTLQQTAEVEMKQQLAEIEKMPLFPKEYETYQQYSQKNDPIEHKADGRNGKIPIPQYLQGAALVVDNSSGRILAMVGGRNFSHSEYNRAFQARRKTGTAFTPFVYLAAYDQGIFPGKVVDDVCMDNRYVMIGGLDGILGEWGVERHENSYEGPLTTHQALVHGKNAATVRLGLEIGLDPVHKLATRAGIASKLADFPKTFLGGSEMTLAEMTLAYTTFPNLGTRPQSLYLIERITDASGNVVYQKYPQQVRVTSPEAAYQVHSALQDVLRTGTGVKAGEILSPAVLGLAAGKTGTSYHFFDSYFVGYTSAVTCSVWIGFDQRQKIFSGAFGNIVALPLGAKLIQQSLQQGFSAHEFPTPKNLHSVQICKASGLLASTDCTATSEAQQRKGVYTEYATTEEMPQKSCNVHAPGTHDFIKKIEPSPWPRAEAVVDLSEARPVSMKSPALLALVDVYHSLRPASETIDLSQIPTQRALLPDAANSSMQPSGSRAIIRNILSEREVRRAEAVDSQVLFDIPAINLPTPPPAKF